ncbi:BgTH12-07881 [Blumeria graminis f. sp. triticale]|uniref:Bgt-1583 n=3 Tax=Blumeria graminis TaxID=34373 RepID=A0A061HH86_BLUGR|nr:ER membrane protein [Blumeria graminis f. sp. tritici 96224]CAD6499524.1 BgTH12-07881 [Blumeria graminis f. sp. triticale]VCU39691.1 Bgt-1583 [Blumeria graminis f. sp. tritici]
MKNHETVTLVPTKIACIGRIAHPALLLSAYYMSFTDLVASPQYTLQNTLLPLTALQVAYAAICLPVAGSNAPRPKRAKRTSPKPTWQVPSISATLIALILTALTVPFITMLMLLCGAPLTSHLAETMLMSAHLALLAIFPLVYIYGLDSAAWLSVTALRHPLDEVFGAYVGAFLGAWLGAVPIPLDWDRDWQRWPITIVTGIYLGYVGGKALGGSAFYGKRIEFD